MAEDERERPLRKMAEKLVGTDLASLQDLTPDQMRDVIHELEIQNEQLIRAKAEIARLTTLYAVLSRVNEAIVRIHDEEALYQEVCRIVAEEGGFPLVWVGRVKERQVTPAASSGPAADYVKEIRVDVEGEFGRGPTGTSIREERPVVNDDFDINPSTAPWREPALRYGFRASAAFPLHRQGRVVGALTLYAAAPGAFDRDHVNLLEALCADISYALDAMHQEQFRTKAEEALRASEEQYRRLVELSPEAIYVNRDNRIELVNSAALRLFGATSADQILGKSPFDLFRRDYHPIVRERIQELLEGRSVPAIEEKIVRLDGAVRDVEIAASFFDDQDGRAIQVMARDITERKRAEEALRASEEALRRANEQLEEKVRERTAELRALNEDLMERRDQLRSLASDLIVTEARERRALALELHDTVAQMLAIAKLTLETTGVRLEGKSAEEVRRVVQLLQEASRQTRFLMADLSPSLLYEVGLGQALRALARRMGELHSLTIEVVDDGNPTLLGEDYRVVLFRAVQELLHNVVKHAKATNVKVSLQREGKQVRLEVEDDGVGFLLSERRRGDGTRERFGLFSIQERLQHLGGSFEIFSQPGRGVRAVLAAPLQVEGEGEGKEPAAVRILIAEDHRMMRDALASLLEKEPGFKIVGLAADGLEAVGLARKAKPDVVLMDVNMPVMDGTEATRQITAELPEVKVIGLSVHAEAQIASKMLAAGASSFVPKSSSPEELTEAIRTAVSSGKGN
ncbi:MAG TPA: response regulator [Syntrophobacteria bacterium]|nr:response regulator [Syntrophobacteria bacterium]